MKPIHKHYPPQLAQMVVIDKKINDETLEKFITTDKPNEEKNAITKINGTDYNLFLWLIYHTHKIYSDKRSEGQTSFVFEYKDVRETLKGFDTASIKKSIERLNNMEFIFNYCQSYGDKDYIIVRPFEIKVIESEKKIGETNISYGFKVNTTEEFMSWFDNPKPLVDVSYSIIFGLNRMSKLLYLFLRDAYGGYKNTVRYRTVDIHKLRNMMNVHNCRMSNTDFVKELNKAKREIDKHSDLTIQKIGIIKKRDLKSGVNEIVAVKFEMMKDEDKIYKFKMKKSKSDSDENTDDTNRINEMGDTTTADELSTDDDIQSFEDYVKEKTENDYQRQISYGKKISNPKGYKAEIKRVYLADDNLKLQFQLEAYLDGVKFKLKQQTISRI